MRVNRSILAALAVVTAVASWIVVSAGQQLPLEPTRERGASVTGAFEGWYPNADGTFTLLVGYFNRNRTEILDIPIGPSNQIEPGGPDQGQPTHFLPRRQWGVFTITVPKDFGTKKLTWTIVANGSTTAIPLWLNKSYRVEPFKDPAMGNTPPVLKFQPNGPALQGPPRGIAATIGATLSQPAELTYWVTDDMHVEPGAQGRGRGPQLTTTLTKFRGPGAVKFANPKPAVDVKDDGKVSTTATFDAPGEYVIRVQANDSSGEGGGGFQCCWTNAHVKVNVTPAAGGSR
jgi:hypothetical protein